MAQVNVRISGRTYRMACDDGQETHLASLAERLDRSIGQLRERFGDIGEQRLTVMAAITFADQQAETERRLRELESEIASLEEANADGLARHAAADVEVAQAIVALAEKVEALADRVAGVGERTNGA